MMMMLQSVHIEENVLQIFYFLSLLYMLSVVTFKAKTMGLFNAFDSTYSGGVYQNSTMVVLQNNATSRRQMYSLLMYNYTS